MAADRAISGLAIDVRGLNKSFGSKHVVRDLSLQVRSGEIYGFLGPNGSGKTTSIRMLCGLLTPDSGAGSCLGHDVIRETSAIKREVGYMTQKFSLYDDLSIEQNLIFTSRVHELDRRAARVEAALERLGLVKRRRQLAGTLSGGWKQRLALAAATLQDIQAISAVWGDEKGMTRDRIARDELEKRTLIMICVLGHEKQTIGAPHDFSISTHFDLGP